MDRKVHVKVAWVLCVSCIRMPHQGVLGETGATVIIKGGGEGGYGPFLVLGRPRVRAAPTFTIGGNANDCLLKQ